MIDRLNLIDEIKRLCLELSMFYGDLVKIEININRKMGNVEINITVKNIK